MPSQVPGRLHVVNGHKVKVTYDCGYAKWVCYDCNEFGHTNHVGDYSEAEEDALQQARNHACKPR